MKTKNKLPFCEAREFARNLGLTGQREWEEYSKTWRPENIPGSPSKYYKNKGWVSWMDWLSIDGKPWRCKHRKYNVNQDYFKTWTRDMAYILGFWFADGWTIKGLVLPSIRVINIY